MSIFGKSKILFKKGHFLSYAVNTEKIISNWLHNFFFDVFQKDLEIFITSLYRLVMLVNLSPKVTQNFECKDCYYITSRVADWNKHILTAKHKRLVNCYKMASNLSPKIVQQFNCECGKNYKHDSSYYKHKKKCTVPERVENTFEHNHEHTKPSNELIVVDNSTALIIEILKQNQSILLENKEFKDMIIEQNKTILDLATKSGNTTINNSNTTNNNFNLQIFLNETCKDAVNINDFIKGLPVSFRQLENIGQNGYVAGITDVILTQLKTMDVTKRPLHCTDLKRDTMYIKETNEWVKDDSDNSKMVQIFRRIAKNNLKTINEWSQQNPNSLISDSKENIFCMGVMLNSLGVNGDAQLKLDNKVLKCIAKLVYVDKH